ncbi:hypothetical protein ZIOFF_010857 [Zingiber officinale]|uniref:Uncharacterized protein n=1 Tax=Zingiber officinale TaxID=94328 RepID=A0A8J5HJS3_ZINOF|nr:hypothetical protein ZIOFF_010857 [Zingiber officinale]
MGIARNCNYFGDLVLALSFNLPCGVSSAMPTSILHSSLFYLFGGRDKMKQGVYKSIRTFPSAKMLKPRSHHKDKGKVSLIVSTYTTSPSNKQPDAF